MTLLQLKYVVEVAAAGTISGAAKKLYIAQPSLTAAIKELEHEIGFSLFTRTNKGVVISPDGEEFLGYARQVIEQANLIEERYFGAVPQKRQFCVSTQHYSFAVEAFVDLIREYGGEEYDFRIRETQTYELIEDVAKLRSEVGVLYLNRFNETVIRKTLREHDLKFTRLFMAKPQYLSVRPIRLQAAVPSPCRIWNLIRVCPMSRASTIPFISPRRSSARWTAARTSWCPTARPCLIF